VKFKIDEDLPVEAAEVLRDSGHDARAVRPEWLVGRLWIVDESRIRVRE
jgi:hypothetical protein